MTPETVICADCGKETDVLAVFPGKRCLACHAAIWDRVPVDQLPRPDSAAFAATVNIGKRRKVTR